MCVLLCCCSRCCFWWVWWGGEKCRVDVRTKWESSIIGTDDDNANIMLTQQRNEMRTEHQRDHGIWYHGLKENTNNGQTMVGSNKQTTLSART